MSLPARLAAPRTLRVVALAAAVGVVVAALGWAGYHWYRNSGRLISASVSWAKPEGCRYDAQTQTVSTRLRFRAEADGRRVISASVTVYADPSWQNPVGEAGHTVAFVDHVSRTVAYRIPVTGTPHERPSTGMAECVLRADLD